MPSLIYFICDDAPGGARILPGRRRRTATTSVIFRSYQSTAHNFFVKLYGNLILLQYLRRHYPFIGMFNSFSAKGNIEVFANNTDSGESARKRAVSPEISIVCLLVIKTDQTLIT